jgi:hypothetical protein
MIEEVAAYLDTSSTKLAQGDTLFVAVLPESTGAARPVAALFADPGAPPRNHYGSDPWAERPRLRVLVRSTDPVAGAYPNQAPTRQLARDIWFLLERVFDETLTASTGTSARYLRIAAASSPYDAGVDDRGRVVVACEYDVERVPSTAA